MADEEEQIKKILTGLQTQGVESSCVVSRDGILMYSDFRDGGNSAAIAAMVATMLGAAEVAMSELSKSIPEIVLVKTGSGRLIVMGAGESALLAVMTSVSRGLEKIIDKVSGASGELKKLLE